MKFIKDIIGERRERVHPSGMEQEASPFFQPDANTQNAAAFDQNDVQHDAGKPFRLEDEFLLDSLNEEKFADIISTSEALGVEAEAPPQDGFRVESTVSEDVAEEEGDEEEGSESAIDAQAITAFLEQDQADSKSGFATETSRFEQAEGPDIESLEVPETGDPFGLNREADFSRLGNFGIGGEQEPRDKSYRIFSRRPKTGAEPDTRSHASLMRIEEESSQAQEADPLLEDVPSLEIRKTPALAKRPAAEFAEAEQTRDVPRLETSAPADVPEAIDVPAPSMGRGASRAGRVKTRLLGFSAGQDAEADPFSRKAKKTEPGYTEFPVGWLTVVKGPGRGAAFTLFNGVSVIGRGEGQTVRLDFGDNSISRDNHAAVAYDPEKKAFYIGHGGKANLVRRNDRPVLSTEELSAGDQIRIGETTLRFVPLCGADFGWDEPQQIESGYAASR